MGRRVDLKEAAELLGSTSEAIRKRAKRGSILSEVGDDGKLYVWVDEQVDGRVDDSAERVDGQVDTPYEGLLIERMASEIDHLREQLKEERGANRENRRIIAGLVQRVPELEPVRETRDAPVSSSEEQGNGETPPDTERRSSERSWWQRWFGR